MYRVIVQVLNEIARFHFVNYGDFNHLNYFLQYYELLESNLLGFITIYTLGFFTIYAVKGPPIVNVIFSQIVDDHSKINSFRFIDYNSLVVSKTITSLLQRVDVY